MARSYLFLQPMRLPLTMADLSEETVHSFRDADALEAALAQAFAGGAWERPDAGPGAGSRQLRAEAADGRWLEFRIGAPEGDGTVALSLRCSLRAHHDDIAQALCDRFGWIAFDDRPFCFQPGRPPMDAGS